jgi:hypothetical protein
LREVERDEDENFSITRALAAKYARHWPGFPLGNVPKWEETPEYDEHQKLKREYEHLGLSVMEGDLLIPCSVLRRPVQMARERSSTTGAKGGYLVASDLLSYDDILRQRSVTLRLGVQPVEAQENNSAWPKQLTASTPAG